VKALGNFLPPLGHPERDFSGVTRQSVLDGGCLRSERRLQILKACPHVAPQSEFRLKCSSKLFRQYIQVNDALAGPRHGKSFGRDFTKLAADDQKQVRFIDQAVGDAIIAAEQTGIERFAARNRTLPPV
jgi:hypothetical protein